VVSVKLRISQKTKMARTMVPEPITLRAFLPTPTQESAHMTPGENPQLRDIPIFFGPGAFAFSRPFSPNSLR
jgi:hypothetical protein